jgi:hypothetical protein
MEGWLEKSSGGHKGGGLRGAMGNMRSTWDRRYVVLVDRSLKCATHHSSSSSADALARACECLSAHRRRYYKTDADAKGGKPAGVFDCRGAKFERFPDGSFSLTNKERELTLKLNPKLLSVVVGDEGERWAKALAAARETDDEKASSSTPSTRSSMTRAHCACCRRRCWHRIT